jgi:hypothetical protein
MVEVLDTLDEFDDSEYTAYQKYQAFRDSYTGTQSILYLNKDFEDYSAWKQYAEYEGLKVIQTDGDTQIC